MQSHFNNYRYFKKGYGEFPYIIIKVGSAKFMQIPIHFLRPNQEVNIKIHPGTQVRDVPENVFKEIRSQQIFLLYDDILEVTYYVLNKIKSQRNKRPEACLVLSKDQALYYYNGKFNRHTYIPTGGTLMDQTNRIIGFNVEHYYPYEISKVVKSFNKN
jgi:hypothetical protein